MCKDARTQQGRNGGRYTATKYRTLERGEGEIGGRHAHMGGWQLLVMGGAHGYWGNQREVSRSADKKGFRKGKRMQTAYSGADASEWCATEGDRQSKE